MQIQNAGFTQPANNSVNSAKRTDKSYFYAGNPVADKFYPSFKSSADGEDEEKIVFDENYNDEPQPEEKDKTVIPPVMAYKNLKKSGLRQKLRDLIYGKDKILVVQAYSQDIPKDFQTELSKGVRSFFEEEIPPQNFSAIIGADELKQILPDCNIENFKMNFDFQNAPNRYFIDLGEHSNFSDDKWVSVNSILDNAVMYANELHKQTGQKFILAIADKDILLGVKHVVRMLGENPEKYENIKFVPAVKLTFAHEAKNSILGYENSSLLVFGINPFSENLNKLVDGIINGRKNMIANFINDVNTEYPEFLFSHEEFLIQNKLWETKDYNVSNFYWRTREYAENKAEIATIYADYYNPDTQKKIIDETDYILYGMSRTGDPNEYNKEYQPRPFETPNEEVNNTIRNIFAKYATHYDEEKGKVVTFAENYYDDVIDTLAKEKEKPVLALSAPFYLSHYFNDEVEDKTYQNTMEFIKQLRDKSEGMLNAVEIVAPVYNLDKELTEEKINDFNNALRSEFSEDNNENGKQKFNEIGSTFYKSFENR